jgi:hypothetical protein
VHDPTCHACPVACKKGGRDQGGTASTWRASSTSRLVARRQLRKRQPGLIAYIIDLCNDYGWTPSSTVRSSAWRWRPAKRS